MMSLQKEAVRMCRHKPLVLVCCVLLTLNLLCLLMLSQSRVDPGDPYYSQDEEGEDGLGLPRLGEAEKALFVEGHLDILNRRRREVVHLVILLTDNSTAPQTLLKSALLFTTATLHLHLFTPDNTYVQRLTSITVHWPKVFSSRLTYSRYKLDCTLLEQYLSAGTQRALETARDRWKVCLISSLGEISMTNYVIVCDPSLIFVSDITELWERFTTFPPERVMEVSPAGKLSVGHRGVGVHTGVLLVSLEAYKSNGFVESFSRVLNILYTSSSISIHTALDLSHWSDTVGLVPCPWNYHSALAQCDPKTGESACPEAFIDGVRALTGDDSQSTVYSILSKALSEYNNRYHKTWVYWNKVLTELLNTQQTHRCKHNVYGLWQALNGALQTKVILLPEV